MADLLPRFALSRLSALGVISLEDLIEEIIGEEIVDETDRYVSNVGKKAARRTYVTSPLLPSARRLLTRVPPSLASRSSAEVMKGIIERERKKLVRMNSIMSEDVGRVLLLPSLRVAFIKLTLHVLNRRRDRVAQLRGIAQDPRRLRF